MRMAFLMTVLVPTACWAYVPDCNVTRGIYVSATLLMSGAWGPWGEGYALDDQVAHSGDRSVKCVSGPAEPGRGVGQVVKLDQEKPEPLKIAGWSKAQGVAGDKDYRYGIYVDLVYTDGEPLHMQIAAFEPGTHDWQYAETIIEPEKPLRSANFWAWLRGKEGVVWYDDLFFGPPDGENLLVAPGFETEEMEDTSARDAVLDTLDSFHANAIHTYTGPGGEQLREMLAATRERGMGVVVTPGLRRVGCVSGRWGDDWVALLAKMAEYPLMGISLVPDEFNWSNAWGRPLREGEPRYCDCPVCHQKFEESYGEPMPPMGQWTRPPEQTDAYRKWIDFRYRSTADWIRRGAEAIKSVNPDIRTDSLICVSPICSDFRLGTGVAWDMMGYGSDIDFPTTDPYILLHNYLGDATHWYVTETTAHLVGCTPKRQAGVVLQNSGMRSRRGEKRFLDPVEIYGSAVSAVSRGAKELAWWHYNYLYEQEQPEGENSVIGSRGAYDLIERIDPWLDGAEPLRRVALLYSRASEEYFSFYTHPEPSAILTHATDNLRYPFLAQTEVLYYLFRRGIPTDLYFLDQVSAEELADYATIVVPFPFAVGEQQAQLLTQLAEAGKSVLIISEFGTVDELGAPLDAPALLDLCGLAAAPTGEKQGALTFAADSPVLLGETLDGFTVYESVQPAEGTRVLATVDGVPAILERSLGSGRVLFLAGEFGIGLPANYDNEVRGCKVRVLPSELSVAHVTVMDALLDELSPGRASLIRQAPPGKDLEVAAMRNAAGDVVLFAINWESDPQSCEVALPEGCVAQGAGFYLESTGAVSEAQAEARQEAGELRLSLDLAGQEARVLRFAAE